MTRSAYVPTGDTPQYRPPGGKFTKTGKSGGTLLPPKNPKAPKKAKGSGGNSGSGSNSAGGNRYGAYGGYAGVRVGDARKLVNAEVRPELRALRNDRQQIRRETQYERQRAQRQYTAAVGDLDHIFGETGDYIGYQNQAIDANYNALTDRTAQAQAALLSHLTGTGQAVQSGAEDELARLGIQGSGDLGELQADQANMMQVAQQTGANNLQNIAFQQQGASDVGNLLAGMNAGGHAAAVGQQATARADALFEAEANKRTAVEQVRRSMKDLRLSRSDLTTQMLEQLRQAGWGQYVDQANIDLQNEQMDLQHQQFAAQQRAQRAYQRAASKRTSYGSGGGSSYYGGSGSGSNSGGSGQPTDKEESGNATQLYNQMVLDNLLGGKKKKKPRK